MYKLGSISPMILKTKEEALEWLESHGIEIQCPKSIADTYTIHVISTTYFNKRKYIDQTWTFEEALKIATKILDEWANHNFDNYNI